MTFIYNIIMRKIILIIMSLSITSLLHSYDFEFEVLSNEGDIRVIELPDLLTYRQFYVKSNWKDTLGDWGIIEGTGSHTLHKEKGTIAKNYCKGTNVEDITFGLIMDRNSNDFDAGIGELKYVKGTGKFKKYRYKMCICCISS